MLWHCSVETVNLNRAVTIPLRGGQLPDTDQEGVVRGSAADRHVLFVSGISK